ncbi:dctM-like transporters family protein [Staphylococcus aureus Lyso 1 2010]|uniref:Na+/H+ antiporter family protein n=1 Tax=Staphylococcus aureus TaxID=1280 RepID=UPI0004D96276|nr:Na+/H+ antiporter family protein [Staphylococcus aureus]KEK33156.1 dctM-like transporters family protein [Staphylococcus aureus LysK 1 2010]KEK35303.1 dctM-like transporters family protein [Staphylococcus aureus Lyso 1 2010]KEK45146.1 dctM-like transporters family protein [Staphylococcus aureus 1101-1 2010]KEK57262.1 dctM-like transporters family protein [Staphylococcus aureus LysK 1 2011]KEK59330.1 dctM-like transporters family protein [Staphylococcus aureus 1101-1 2011]
MINAVVIAVILMIVLCLCRLNVVISLFISALVGGLISGMSIEKVINVFGKNIVDGAEVALSYALLGGFAALISYSGITDYLVGKIINAIHAENSRWSRVKVKVTIIIALLAMSIMSQNLIPVHIAFIPIVIPPLLSLFNDLKIDRRLIGLIIGFGLCFPYVLLPYGFGQIFQQIIQSGFAKANHPIEFNMIWKAMLIPSMGYIVGLLIGLYVYRKPREYETRKISDSDNVTELKPYILIVTIVAILATFLVQTFTDSMIFGALAGGLVFFISRAYNWYELDAKFVEGIKIMAYIGVVILTANGFAGVMNATGDIDELVKTLTSITGDNKLFSIIMMYVIGLIVTLGIGSSFATIPIIASLFIPFGASIGLDTMALIALIGTASALGDSGSPASDSTLGPTAGLNVDGQHDHIRDTCVPNFLFYNIPLMIFGTIAAMVL